MSVYKPMTRQELYELAGEELPERAAMSPSNSHLLAPANAAAAANALADTPAAVGDAAQGADVAQRA